MNDYLLFAVGIFLILIPLVFVVAEPAHFVDAQYFLRLIASLGGGLVGIAIPGILSVGFASVRASGGLALVIFFYTQNPAATFNAHQALESAKVDQSSDFDIAENTNRPSFDLPTAVKTTDLKVCETACLSNDACVGFVVRKAGQPAEGCYLKSQIDPKVVLDQCCTAGIRHKPAHYELRSSFVDDFLDCAVDGTPVPRLGFHHGGVQTVSLDQFVHPQSRGTRVLQCKLTDTGGTDGHPCWGFEFEIWRNNALQSKTENIQCDGRSPQTPTIGVPMELDAVDIKIE